VTEALAEAATLGPFFALAVGGEAGSWRPAADLPGDGLNGLLATAGERLGVTEARVAASIVQLGYAARLWSPVLACALQRGIVPDLAGLRVGVDPVRLGVPAARGWQATEPGQVAGLAYRVVVTEHLEPLVGRLPVTVADGLLWGNAASAMTGALGVLTAARPDLERAARTLAEFLLATGSLRGTGRLTGPGVQFRRNSCCLYYRVPGGGTCGDCSLNRRPP
jgi:hypothetical protein